MKQKTVIHFTQTPLSLEGLPRNTTASNVPTISTVPTVFALATVSTARAVFTVPTARTVAQFWKNGKERKTLM